CQVVTGGGSGSVEFDLASGVFTEIQPGSYVFMDGDYGSNEGVAASGTGGGIGGGIDGGGAAEALRFEHSLFIATTVMSTAAQGQVVVDAGLKSMAVDSGLPWVWERNTGERNAGERNAGERHGGQFGGGRRSTRLAYVAANDEHGIVRPVPAAGGELPALPQLGEPLWLVPGHCDPTLNLYDTLVGVRDGKVESLWPISARGLSR
ncbi:alanine racemase, partial [Cupriavidus sp. HPC(L)]